MRISLVLLFFFFFVPSISFAEVKPPDGWRYANDSDYKNAWQEFTKDIKIPYHVQADFNGDGLKDDAWILVRTDKPGWGLFIFLARKDSPPEIYTIEEEKDNTYLDTMGIVLVDPGKYETCIGKGYDLEYPPDEPKMLVLKHAAIDFLRYASADTYIYWVDKTHSFRETCISD